MALADEIKRVLGETLGRAGMVDEIAPLVDRSRCHVSTVCNKLVRKKELRRWPGSPKMKNVYGLLDQEYPKELDRSMGGGKEWRRETEAACAFWQRRRKR